MAVQRHLFLCQRQRLAASDADLPGDQVEAGDGLGDRVFHLQAGVHFHEEELAAFVEEEFDGTGADVADRLRRAYRGLAHGPAQFRAETGGGGFLDDLLVAALDRTVAFVEVQAVAMAIGEYLDLHVARLQQVFLHQHPRVAEGGLGLALGGGKGLGQLGFVLHHLHALAAAASGGLEQDRVADPSGFPAEGLGVLGFAVVAGHQRHAGFFHQRLGRRLAAHGVDGRRRRPEEEQAGFLAGAGEVGVLREEAVAGVDRLGAAGEGGGDDPVAAQVAVGGLGAAQVDGDVGFGDVAGVAVDVAVHGDAADAEGARAAHHPAGDLAAVGDQDALDAAVVRVHASFLQAGVRFSRKARRPSWPSGLMRMRAMAASV